MCPRTAKNCTQFQSNFLTAKNSAGQHSYSISIAYQVKSSQVKSSKTLLHHFWVVVVLRSPIHANEPSEYNGMLYRTSNRVLNNGIKVIILICMDGTSQYHHHPFLEIMHIMKAHKNTNKK